MPRYLGVEYAPTTMAGPGRWYLVRRTDDGTPYDESVSERFASLAQLKESVRWDAQRSSAASLLGARGGRAKSAAKTAAVRANGAKGGRPRKVL